MPDTRKTGAWLLLLLVVAAALAIVIIPVWIIRPFSAQTPNGLRTGYLLRTWSPAVTVAAAIVTLGLVIFLWRRTRRWWSKALLLIVLALVLVPVWFARQNHFEWMFNPLPSPGFVRAADASFVDSTDKVITIELNGEAVAYPVRQIAYHHVVQDEVGGVKVVATY